MSRRASSAALAVEIPCIEERGYRVVYHDDEVNRCPGCGRTSWHIGRSTAECAFCGTALPLRDAAR